MQINEMPENTEESPWLMEEEGVKKRRDLRRTHLVFSIDPKGCEDVDDTLSVRYVVVVFWEGGGRKGVWYGFRCQKT